MVQLSVPDAFFVAGATWRAVDKTHNPEWNTVAPRPSPTQRLHGLLAALGLRQTRHPSHQPFHGSSTYYPDGTNGDWSATGNWNDSACAPKPPATPVTVGFGYGAWFPYASTNYHYPNGGSLAYIYPQVGARSRTCSTPSCSERYQIWKAATMSRPWTRLRRGHGAHQDRPPKTVSEGQGYGMAISAAIGDQPTFDALWNFVRHYLSQSAKKYCGGLMGWMWDGSICMSDA